jgi:hypothetical protein
MHVVLLLTTLVPQWPAVTSAQAASAPPTGLTSSPAPAQAEDQALQTAIPCSPLTAYRLYLPTVLRNQAATQDAATQAAPASEIPAAVAEPGADLPACAIAMNEDTTASIALPTLPLSTTTPLTYSIQTAPGHGAVSLIDRVVTYTPTLNFHGSDSLEYSVAGGQLTYHGVVNLTVAPVNDDPSVAISAQPTSGSAPLTVTFSAQASDVDQDQLSAQWNFGDGSAAGAGLAPAHVYAAAGAYTATVTVADGHGGTASAQQQIQVGPAGA